MALWRSFASTGEAIRRRIDAELVELHDLSLAHFEVLSSLRAAGGSLRVGQLCAELGEVPSSFSRRLDRMEDDGLVTRAATPTADDRRAVTVTLSREGRLVWRDANVTYRRLVQQQFAQRLTDTDISALQRVLGKTAPD